MRISPDILGLSVDTITRSVRRSGEFNRPVIYGRDGAIHVLGMNDEICMQITFPGEGEEDFGPFKVGMKSMQSLSQLAKVEGVSHAEVNESGIIVGQSRVEWNRDQTFAREPILGVERFSDEYDFNTLKRWVHHLECHTRFGYRIALSGIFLDQHGFCSSDGSRMLFIPRPHNLPRGGGLLIPALYLKRALSVPEPFRPKSVHMAADEVSVLLQWSTELASIRVWIKLIDRAFPKYRRVISRRPESKVSAHLKISRSLVKLLKVHANMGNRKYMDIVTQLTLKKGRPLELVTVRSLPYERLDSAVDVQRVTGDVQRIIQTPYLSEAIQVFPPGDRVRIEVHGPSYEEPIHLVSLSTGIRAVIMPVRLAEDRFAPHYQGSRAV